MSKTDSRSAEEQTPGEVSKQLVAAREKLGLTRKDVADRLNLTATLIKYLDEGDFGKMPRPAFVRGYLRSYARAVKLPVDEIMDLYEKEVPAVELSGVSGRASRKSGATATTANSPVSRTPLIALAVLVLVAGAVWWAVGEKGRGMTLDAISLPLVPEPGVEQVAPDFDDRLTDSDEGKESEEGDGGGEFQSEDEPGSSPDAQEARAHLADAGQSAPDAQEARAHLADAGQSAPDAPAEEVEEAKKVEEGLVTGESGGVEVAKRLEDNKTRITVDAGGPDLVELTFSGECWVEVTDGARGRVYRDLVDAGHVLNIQGRVPFEILLGNVTRVEMLYNGRPVDLASFATRSNTARVLLKE